MKKTYCTWLFFLIFLISLLSAKNSEAVVWDCCCNGDLYTTRSDTSGNCPRNSCHEQEVSYDSYPCGYGYDTPQGTQPKESAGTGAGSAVTLQSPIDIKDPNVLIGRIIKAALGIVGSLALVMFIFGGFVWMTSVGNNEKVTKGKNIIIWATLGLVVVFAAYAAVSFVLKDVIGLQGGGYNAQTDPVNGAPYTH
jgi:hypothetical protein